MSPDQTPSRRNFRPLRDGYLSRHGISYFSFATDIRVAEDFSYLKFIESLGSQIFLKLDLNPVERNASMAAMRRMIADRASELRLRRVMENRARVQDQVDYLRKTLSDAEKGNTRVFNLRLSFKVQEAHPVLLKNRKTRMTSVLSAIGIKTEKLRPGRRKTMEKLANPFIAAKGNYLMDSNAITGILPVSFTSPPSGGILIGMDESNEYPVFLDIFSGNSYNCIVSGETGSGKSFFCKLFISRMLRTGLAEEVAIIDPLGEYREEMFTKISRKPGPDESVCGKVTVMRPDGTGSLTDRALSTFSSGMGRKMLVIDEAHRLMESREMRSDIDRLVRHSRHSNLSVFLITQNLSDFFSSEQGRSILSNSGNVFSFRGKKFQLDMLGSLVTGDTEVMDISTLAGGKNDPYSECIYLNNGKLRRMRVICSKNEFEKMKISGS